MSANTKCRIDVTRRVDGVKTAIFDAYDFSVAYSLLDVGGYILSREPAYYKISSDRFGTMNLDANHYDVVVSEVIEFDTCDLEV